MLESHYYKDLIEAGCDEAGRGCLAGSVYAAAVILPPGYQNEALNDSKQLTDKRRKALRKQIERDAVAWAVGIVTPEEIDKINILNASILAMHRALDQLKVRPEAIIVDGNRFKPYHDLPHTTIVKGDGKYMAIAAASILAKTYRDDYMDALAEEYPQYKVCKINVDEEQELAQKYGVMSIPTLLVFKNGEITKVFTTNLIYRDPGLTSREWHYEVDMSKYVSLLIDTLNHDDTISHLLDPVTKIHNFIEKRGNK